MSEHGYEDTQASLSRVRASLQQAIDLLAEFVAHESDWDLNHLYVAVHLRTALTHVLQARDEVGRR